MRNLILTCVILVTTLWCSCAIVDGKIIEKDDAVIVEAADLDQTASEPKVRKSRQFFHAYQADWGAGIGEGSTCLTSKGILGSCTSFKHCYPYFKIPNLGLWESWVLGNYDTCSFYNEKGEAVFGVCCTNPLPPPIPGQDNLVQPLPIPPIPQKPPAGVSSEESNKAPFSVEHWPPTHPPLPTHPPDHTAATHPPAFGGATTEKPDSKPKPPKPTTTKKPATTWPTKPPTVADWATEPTTHKPIPTAPPAVVPINSACGARNLMEDSERIVGGTNAAPNSWPWVVVLFNGGRQFCGGSLIDNVHILTAAHCIAHMSSWDVARLTVHLGDYDIKTTAETQHVTRKIKRLVRHRGFDSRTLYNDVAILTMDSPVQFSQNIKPICLPSSTRLYNGLSATVVGWGSLRENGPQPAKLQEVSIAVWTNQECATKYGPAAPGGIIETMLCAGQANRDSCSGDSGGPLMINEGKWTQAGIVSWGIGCGKGQYPGVYTRVTHFMDWITKNIKDM